MFPSATSPQPTPRFFLVPQHTSPHEIQRQVRKQLLIYPSIIITAIIIIFLVMNLYIKPQMMNLYQEFEVQLPFAAQHSGYLSIGTIILTIFITIIITRNPQYTSEPAEGGYLKITPRHPRALEPLIIITLGLIVGILTFTFITPIYTLTSFQ